jgi:hypothetical protein
MIELREIGKLNSLEIAAAISEQDFLFSCSSLNRSIVPGTSHMLDIYAPFYPRDAAGLRCQNDQSRDDRYEDGDKEGESQQAAEREGENVFRDLHSPTSRYVSL